MAEPVAIVGMACRFPDADTPARYWQNMLEGRVSFQELANQRWTHSEFLGPARDRWKTPCTHAALAEDVDLFAARHFEIAPRRAQMMDPQQRLVMELGHQALQDAGLEGRAFDRHRSGVFVGASVSEYAGITAVRTRVRQVLRGEYGSPGEIGSWPELLDSLDPIQPHTMAGCLLNMIAAGVAQTQDFRGPALTIDAACASSLVAVQQACAYLGSLGSEGPSPVALAGGVYLLLLPENPVAFGRAGVLAESTCLPYEERASGFLIGEGAALVALKRLEHAVADGDRIYAVLSGWAVNNDGLSQAAAAPNAVGQAECMRAAVRCAGRSFADIAYVEGHGTGTVVGDRAELEAIGECWGGALPWLGSSKANVGHCLTAAGMAGLLRAALAVYHATVPPQAGWESGAQGVPREAGPLRGLALVNAFGFGGTNSSVVLEPAPARELGAGKGPWPVVAGAANRELLAEYLAALHHSLAEPLGAWAWSLSCRAPAACGVRFLASTAAEAARELTRLQGEGSFGPVLPEPEAFPKECRRIVDLPPQPLLRESFWQVKGRPPAPRGPGPEERWRNDGRVALDPSLPWLAAHRLRGRCLLPLALGVDLLAWRAGLKPPFSLFDIRVERPLFVDEPLWIRLTHEGDRVGLYQGRRLYVSARVGAPGPPPTPLEGADAPGLSVADFYAAHTFHGPALQGLQAVTDCSETTVAGRVGAGELRPVPVVRAGWCLEPTSLDAAMQLALFWSVARRGRGLFPADVAELAVLEPWPATLDVAGQIAQENEQGLVGDAVVRSEGRLVGWVRGLAGRYTR